MHKILETFIKNSVCKRLFLEIRQLFTGKTSLEFSDLFLADGAVIGLGEDQDVTLTHVHDTGILLNSTNKIQFNDASQFIHGSSNAVLSLGATDEIDLTATAIDINGTVDMSGNTAVGGTFTSTGKITADAGIDVDLSLIHI